MTQDALMDHLFGQAPRTLIGDNAIIAAKDTEIAQLKDRLNLALSLADERDAEIASITARHDIAVRDHKNEVARLKSALSIADEKARRFERDALELERVRKLIPATLTALRDGEWAIGNIAAILSAHGLTGTLTDPAPQIREAIAALEGVKA